MELADRIVGSKSTCGMEDNSGQVSRGGHDRHDRRGNAMPAWMSFSNAMQALLPIGALESGVVVGLSGGRDSSLLLAFVVRWFRENHLAPELVHAVHVNHGLRDEEGLDDEAASRRLARRLRTAFWLRRTAVSTLAHRLGCGPEAAGRLARRTALAEVAGRTGAAVVLLGHHRDDQIETVWLNAVRGSSVCGLAGIPVRRGMRPLWVRPLLGVASSAIQQAAEATLDGWCMDRTNSDTRLRRNHTRHTVLPRLRSDWPAADRSLLRLGELAGRLYAWRQPHVEALCAAATLSVEPAGTVLALEAIQRWPRAFRGDCLRRICRTVSAAATGPWLKGAIPPLCRRHVELLDELCREPPHGDGLDLPGGIRALCAYGQLRIEVRTVPPNEPEYLCLRSWSDLPWSHGGWSLRASAWPAVGGRLCAGRAGQATVDAASIAFPVCLRPPAPGDRFHPLGAPGSTTVAAFLRDGRVPPWKRARARILFDRKGILWVWPYRIDQRLAITGTTEKRVCLTLERHELLQRLQ